MHSLYFVRLKRESEQETSEHAQNRAETILNANGFAGESGFYSHSKADWFVVGGRFSGALFRHSELYAKGLEAIRPMLEKEIKEHRDNLLDYLYINDHLISKEKVEEVDKAFKAVTGVPYFRSVDWADRFSEDNAVVVGKAELATLKDKFGDCEVALVSEEADWIDAEVPLAEVKDDELLGSWVVIIDYHN